MPTKATYHGSHQVQKTKPVNFQAMYTTYQNKPAHTSVSFLYYVTLMSGLLLHHPGKTPAQRLCLNLQNLIMSEANEVHLVALYFPHTASIRFLSFHGYEQSRSSWPMYPLLPFPAEGCDVQLYPSRQNHHSVLLAKPLNTEHLHFPLK